MGTVARSDIFGRVHKGIRKGLFDLAFLAGRTDYTNSDDLARLKAQAAEAMYFLRKHGHIEDTYQLPLIAGTDADIVEKISGEHGIVEQQLEAMDAALAHFDDITTDEDRRAAGESFYFAVNSFIAGYLLHMHEEETVIAPLFFQHCSDQELEAMLTAIIANNSPSDSMLMLKYAVPAIDPHERASFLGAIRQGVPAPVFENILKFIEGVLNASEFAMLSDALELQEASA